MKLWIFPDLHLGYAPLRDPPEIPDADICIVVGDLRHGPVNGVRWLADHVTPSTPCVYVAGNHESSEGSIGEGLEEAGGPRRNSPACISWRTTPWRSAASSPSAPRSGPTTASRISSVSRCARAKADK